MHCKMQTHEVELYNDPNIQALHATLHKHHASGNNSPPSVADCPTVIQHSQSTVKMNTSNRASRLNQTDHALLLLLYTPAYYPH